EIDPREVLPHGNDAADQVLALTGKLADIEGRVEKVKAQLIDGEEFAPLVDVLRVLDGNRSETVEALAEAQRPSASPLSNAWGDCQSLLKMLAASPNPEETRTLLRRSIRKITDGIWCLFVVRGATRLAAVQMWFVGGGHRDFLIVSKKAQGGSVP